MKITIIGCGNMGKAFAQRLSSDHTVFLYDRTYEKAEALQGEGYGTACRKLEDANLQADAIILAVKPNGLMDVANAFSYGPQPGQILISLLAGTPIARIKKNFPKHRIVRMMPNLALLYGEGLIGLAIDKPLSRLESERILDLCKPLGKVYWLDEAMMNAFTALASSGPAFVFAMMESMVDAGVKMGFSAQISEELVHQMIKGSLLLLEKSGKRPDELQQQIASPGGTTRAGLKTFEELRIREGIASTFLAALERANEMG